VAEESSSLVDDARYDGATAAQLGEWLGLPRLVLLPSVGSTQDVAHRLAADGAPAGTLVLADEQTAGRGRAGKSWTSRSGSGIWMTMIERPADASALEVLSLRLGIRAAAMLDRFAEGRVQLKWPNDLYTGAGKLAGILVEARWREGTPDWVAIGVGLNVESPGVAGAAGLRTGVRRIDVLRALVPELHAAASVGGRLDTLELERFEERHIARGRRCSAPIDGVVAGLDASGALIVIRDDGARELARGGSLILMESEAVR
jgi:BirA family transcriptional regulator, biotin operon repressor / biotin---[acetyl-CoA-carboxylase] ligase